MCALLTVAGQQRTVSRIAALRKHGFVGVPRRRPKSCPEALRYLVGPPRRASVTRQPGAFDHLRDSTIRIARNQATVRSETLPLVQTTSFTLSRRGGSWRLNGSPF
jgi:hypothetical protein